MSIFAKKNFKFCLLMAVMLMSNFIFMDLALAKEHFLPEHLYSPTKQEAPDAKNIAKANQILAIYNNLFEELQLSSDAWLEQLLKAIAFCEKHYYSPELPEMPKMQLLSQKDAQIILDNQEKEQVLQANVQAIMQILQEINQQWQALEDYIFSDIQDDGKQRVIFLASLRSLVSKYRLERRKLFALLLPEVEKAQDILLYQHPLRVQFLAGDFFLRRLQVAPALLTGEKIDLPSLKRWRKELEGILQEMNFLPFTKSGLTEMYWRNFLNKAAEFPKTLALTENTPKDSESLEYLRKQLNLLFRQISQSWNDFVAQVH